MNLESAIREEHSKAQRGKIVDFIGDQPTRFAELMKLFLAGNTGSPSGLRGP